MFATTARVQTSTDRAGVTAAFGVADLDDLVLEPISEHMILDGAPVARASALARTKDGKSWTAVWDCTSGRFRWNFEVDETVYILEGSVTVTHDDVETTLRAGDVAFFAAGLRTVWDVDDYVKKIAFLREGRVSLRARLRQLPFLRRAVRGARSLRARREVAS